MLRSPCTCMLLSCTLAHSAVSISSGMAVATAVVVHYYQQHHLVLLRYRAALITIILKLFLLIGSPAVAHHFLQDSQHYSLEIYLFPFQEVIGSRQIMDTTNECVGKEMACRKGEQAKKRKRVSSRLESERIPMHGVCGCCENGAARRDR